MRVLASFFTFLLYSTFNFYGVLLLKWKIWILLKMVTSQVVTLCVALLSFLNWETCSLSFGIGIRSAYTLVSSNFTNIIILGCYCYCCYSYGIPCSMIGMEGGIAFIIFHLRPIQFGNSAKIDTHYKVIINNHFQTRTAFLRTSCQI